MFKEKFKYYKSKTPIPKLDEVIDFQKVEEHSTKLRKYEIAFPKERTSTLYGMKPIKSWEVYELLDHPGLLYIKNPFTSLGHRYWSIRCLQDYSKKPNKSNLDSQTVVPKDKEWWDMCQNNKDKRLLQKLRWITFGYHHNWDTKIYSDESRTDFPKDLSYMCKYLADLFGYVNFNAEAAIVNYYHMDSTLSGHTDHSEQNLEAPLFSFSFGQTAIFLLGGKTLEEDPSAVFLRSGDIVIMSKESRLSYHGVPKILQVDSQLWDTVNENEFYMKKPEDFSSIINICRDDDLWKPFGDYLSSSRININVRQVLNRGQKRLNCLNE